MTTDWPIVDLSSLREYLFPRSFLPTLCVTTLVHVPQNFMQTKNIITNENYEQKEQKLLNMQTKLTSIGSPTKLMAQKYS